MKIYMPLMMLTYSMKQNDYLTQLLITDFIYDTFRVSSKVRLATLYNKILIIVHSCIRKQKNITLTSPFHSALTLQPTRITGKVIKK